MLYMVLLGVGDLLLFGSRYACMSRVQLDWLSGAYDGLVAGWFVFSAGSLWRLTVAYMVRVGCWCRCGSNWVPVIAFLLAGGFLFACWWFRFRLQGFAVLAYMGMMGFRFFTVGHGDALLRGSLW